MNPRDGDRHHRRRGAGGDRAGEPGLTRLAVGLLASSVVTAVPAGAITLAAVGL